MSRSLPEWLDYQLRTHPQAIAMGLERVREVALRLGLPKPASHVVTIGGTNGKGSTVAFVEAIARASGLRVGAFTSPHLLRYNERVRVDGEDVDDAKLVAAFERIEAARLGAGMEISGRHGESRIHGDIPLTYFEFGTLAALLVFADAGLDLAILEVGLGGKLDAVNIVDTDVAVITTVDLDHQAYLGPDRETIGADKACIFRAGKPCVLAEADPPSSVLRHAYEIGAFAIRANADYLVDVRENDWTWREPGFEIELPMPVLRAPAQVGNAAAAVAALRALPFELSREAIAKGVRDARVPGRLQVIAEAPEVLLDVAHNPQAAAQLADWLAAHPRKTRAVFSVLRDKDVDGIVRPLLPQVSQWYLAGIDDAGPRGMSAAEVADRIAPSVADENRSVHATIDEAFQVARRDSTADERVLVFGSFHTVAAVLRGHGTEPERV